MGVDLRLPNITGNEKEQLVQIRSYLYQLVPQLQHALSTIGTVESQVVAPTAKSLFSTGTGGASNNASPQSTFNSIKSLIIKSAEIVEAYYEVINKRLEGVYVAQSDFGAFAEKTSQEIEANSTSTTQRFENIQIIITQQGNDINSLDGTLNTIGTDLSYAQQDILTLGGNVEEVAESVTTLEGDINELDTNLKDTSATFNENLGKLDTDLKDTAESLNESIITTEANLSSAITDAKTEISGNVANEIAAAKEYTDSAKSELSGEIDTAKAEIEGSIDVVEKELTDKVDGVTEDLNNKQSETNGKIAALDADLQASKETINKNIQGAYGEASKVNALLDDAKAQLKGSIDDLEFLVTGLKNVIIGVTAYVKSGLLYYTEAGIPVYGLEIGQTVTDEVSKEEVFNKYARFTSEKLSFYDSNDIEVAYISDKKLYIKIAHITVAFQIGGLIDLVMDTGDVVTKWVGTGG